MSTDKIHTFLERAEEAEGWATIVLAPHVKEEWRRLAEEYRFLARSLMDHRRGELASDHPQSAQANLESNG